MFMEVLIWTDFCNFYIMKIYIYQRQLQLRDQRVLLISHMLHAEKESCG